MEVSVALMREIDLEELTLGEVRNLAGHDRGLKAREHFALDNLDHEGEVVDVVLPGNFRAISPSFFQGMFSKSVQHFRNAPAFFAHYHFDAPSHIRARLIQYAEQAASRQ